MPRILIGRIRGTIFHFFDEFDELNLIKPSPLNDEQPIESNDDYRLDWDEHYPYRTNSYGFYLKYANQPTLHLKIV